MSVPPTLNALWSRRVHDYTKHSLRTEQAAKEEFKLQTGTMPLKLHWSRKSQEHTLNTDNTATMVLAVPETSAPRIPPWIHFFGKNLRIKRKIITPKVQQCARCWDYHSPRSCTR